MPTAAARLVELSGLSGVSAATHLLAIGTGATAAALLVFGSGLETGTAAAHLLADRGTVVEPQLPASLGYAPMGERRRKKPHDEAEDDRIDEAMPPAMVSRLRDEMLSATLAADVVDRAQEQARKSKRRKDAAILLLMSV